MQLLYHDAKGTNGADLSQVDAVYEYLGQQVRIPASTPPDKTQEAVFAALGLDPQQETNRQAKLENARAENTTPIDPAIADGEEPVIQLLVKKIAWLEQEIADLRTGHL